MSKKLEKRFCIEFLVYYNGNKVYGEVYLVFWV